LGALFASERPPETGGPPRRLDELEKVGACFVLDGGEEGFEDCDAGFGEAAGGVQSDLARQMLERAAQRGDRVGEARKTGIAADLTDGTQDADGTELLEDIGVAEDDGFGGGGVVPGLMLADDLEDGGDFRFGEAGVAEDLRGVGAGVSDMIPAGEFLGILGAVADEDAEIMKPGGGQNDVAVVVESDADGVDERLQAGLVSKFVDGAGLIPDEVAEPVEGTGLHITFVPQMRQPPGRQCQSGMRLRKRHQQSCSGN